MKNKFVNNVYNNFLNLFRYNPKLDWDNRAYKHMANASSILDAGCGLGRFISQDPDKIIGLENNPVNFNIAKNKGYKVIQGNITNIPFKNETFGGIYCSHVIEHLNPSELHAALKEFDRILKNNGYLIIVSPLMWIHFYSDLTHIRPYNPPALIHYLTGGGQRTREIISDKYEVLDILWRHTPLTKILFKKDSNKILYKILDITLLFLDIIIYKLKLGFIFKKNGYMLIMKKIHKAS